MLPFGVTIPATVPQGSEIPEGLMNNPVHFYPYHRDSQYSEQIKKIRTCKKLNKTNGNVRKRIMDSE
jgi:hypothetical protein